MSNIQLPHELLLNKTIMNWICIFLGGGLGSILRYSFSLISIFQTTGSPLNTLMANAAASLVLGYLSYTTLNALECSDPIKLGITVGFCGGLSTFSTFSAESMDFLQSGQLISFCIYAIGSIIVCLFAFLIGIKLAGA